MRRLRHPAQSIPEIDETSEIDAPWPDVDGQSMYGNGFMTHLLLGESSLSCDPEPLPDPARSTMEGAYGTSLDHVTVAEGGLATAHGARAAAGDGHIDFAPGEFDPTSEDGLALIGHEIAHLLQQEAGLGTSVMAKDGVVSDPALEAQADALGARAARGQSVSVSGSGGGRTSGVVQFKDPTDPEVEADLAQEEDGTDLRALSNEELHTRIENTRRALVDRTADLGETYLVLSEELARLELEATLRGLDPPDRTAGHPTLTYRDVTFTDDPVQVHARLERLIAEKGADDAADFVRTWVRKAKGPHRGAITALVVAQHATLQRENEAYLSRFETRANDNLRRVLQGSAAGVRAEIDRYGLERRATNNLWVAHEHSVSMDPEHLKARAELQEAVRVLHAQRKENYRAAVQAGAAQGQFNLEAMVDLHSAELDERLVSAATRQRRDDTKAEANRVGAETDAVQASMLAEHPIIATYENLRQLGLAAESVDGEGLAEKAWSILDSIRETQERIGTPDLNVWKLDNIVNMTRVSLSVAPGSMHGRLLDDKVARENAPNYTLIVIGLLTFVAALALSLPTGGSSLAAWGLLAIEVGALALDAYFILQALDDYEVQSDLANTDFSLALSVASERPSLVWLALDIALSAAGGKGVADAATAAARSIKVSRAMRGIVAASDALEQAQSAQDAAALIRRLKDSVDENYAMVGAQLDGPSQSAVVSRLVEAAAKKNPHVHQAYQRALTSEVRKRFGARRVDDLVNLRAEDLTEDEVIRALSVFKGRHGVTDEVANAVLDVATDLKRLGKPDRLRDILALAESAEERNDFLVLYRKLVRAGVDGKGLLNEIIQQRSKWRGSLYQLRLAERMGYGDLKALEFPEKMTVAGRQVDRTHDIVTSQAGQLQLGSGTLRYGPDTKIEVKNYRFWSRRHRTSVRRQLVKDVAYHTANFTDLAGLQNLRLVFARLPVVTDELAGQFRSRRLSLDELYAEVRTLLLEAAEQAGANRAARSQLANAYDRIKQNIIFVDEV